MEPTHQFVVSKNRNDLANMFNPQSSFAFGQQPTAAAAPAAGSLFGSTTPFGTNATQPASVFGTSKPTFGAFGATSAAAPSSSIFGVTAPQQSQARPLFGNSTMSTPTTSLFGAAAPTATGMGSVAPLNVGVVTPMGGSMSVGSSKAKFIPAEAVDIVQKGGQPQHIQTKHQCICAMKEYEDKSLEELRVEDYTAGRKGPQVGGGASIFGVTGAPVSQAQPFSLGVATSTATGVSSLFGGSSALGNTGSIFSATNASKPLFGAGPTAVPNSSFGQVTQSSSLFGQAPKPSIFGNTPSAVPASTGNSIFGTPGATSNFAFAQPQNSTASSLFGAHKPTFGVTTTTSTGLAQSSGFSFGQQSQPTSIFGAKPATTGSLFGSGTPAFGAATSSAAPAPFSFNQPSAGTGSIFGQPAQPKPFGSFGAAGTNSAFSFGAGTSTGVPALGANTGTGLFSTTQPAKQLFGAGPTAATGFPTAAGVAPGTTGSAFSFGGAGGGLGAVVQPTAPLAGGLGPFGGSSLFGANQQQSVGTTVTSLGLSSNQMEAIAEQACIQQQVLDLVRSMPYGHSPLFKSSLNPSNSDGTVSGGVGAADGRRTTTVPLTTNPEAQKAAQLRLSMKPISRPKTKLLPPNRKQLFSGFDEEEVARNSSDSFFVRRSEWRRLDLPSVGGRSSLGRCSSLAGDTSAPFRHSFTSELQQMSTPIRDDAKDSLDTTSPVKMSLPVNHKVLTESVSLLPSNSNSSPQQSTSPLTNKTSRLGYHGHQLDSSLANSEDANVTCWSPGAETDLSETSMLPDSSGRLQDQSPHVCGILMSKPGYYTLPTLEELADQGLDDDGHCWVEEFVVGRQGYGRILFPEKTDVAGLNLDEIVHIRRKEVTVYPDDEDKPPVGTGLNRLAEVTLDSVWPTDKSSRTPIRDLTRLHSMQFETKLERATDRMQARFVEYRPETGSWVFEVKHFSKYRYEESDDEDDMCPSPQGGLQSDKGITVAPITTTTGASGDQNQTVLKTAGHLVSTDADI